MQPGSRACQGPLARGIELRCCFRGTPSLRVQRVLASCRWCGGSAFVMGAGDGPTPRVGEAAVATLSLPHPILFVFDLANEAVEIPEYVAGEATAANDSCVSVNTQAGVDGDVTVRLANALRPSDKEGCTLVFKGQVSAPSRRVAVVTSELDKVLEVEISGQVAEVTIAVDDARGAGVVCVEAC